MKEQSKSNLFMLRFLALLLFYSPSIFAQLDFDCAKPYDFLYQNLNMTTESQYLSTLKSIYSSSSQNEMDQRKSTMANIVTPQYGTFGFKQNKSKIYSVEARVNNSTDKKLATSDYVDLISTYTRPGDYEIAAKSWLECLSMTMGLSSIKLNSQSDSTVQVIVHLVDNEYTNDDDLVKVRDIVTSDNLTLVTDGGVKKDAELNFGRYSMKFRRIGTEPASVDLLVDKGIVKGVNIPALDVAPIYQTISMTGEHIFLVYGNRNRERMSVSPPKKYKAKWYSVRKNLNDDIVATFNARLNSNIEISNISYVPLEGSSTGFSIVDRRDIDGRKHLTFRLDKTSNIFSGNIHIIDQ